ncbi:MULTISPECIES: carboxymuconolactone decarboxylase family protein [unclassified Halomonas]|uniref:carboxymuconolactone decarboxylase family protein n=1 Tax=unclassified Halomonas TaxID=2609666 RepID=UPI0020768B8E|nr:MULTISPECIES: carboxymuconolactone decarboxylase family protein [unclassified Halomonas]
MTERLSRQQVYQLAPWLKAPLITLSRLAPKSRVTPAIKHLVELRVSQLNGCAFCQRLHAEEARDSGERQARLDVLPVWAEVDAFDPLERAALAWAEALTLVHQHAIDDATFDQTLAAFGERDLLALTSIVIAMNGWNRLAVGMRFAPDRGM